MLINSILITAGGTGGHVFPGIAVAHEFQVRNIHIDWLGTDTGMEEELVTKNNIPFFSISISGLRGKSKLSWLFAPFKILIAVWQAIKIIRCLNPDAVLGMGGYVSGPVGIAAWLLRKPLYIHEQNAIAGMTNKLLARFSKKVFAAFSDSFPLGCHAIICGNPIRQEIVQLNPPVERYAEHQGPLRLLVLGGSQGAIVINKIIPFIRKHFSSQQLLVWHQTGAKGFFETREQYQMLQAVFNDALQVSPFLYDMSAAYAWADIVICRAGALTVCELATVGVASILVPFPYAVDDHQTYNAHYLEHADAAIVIQERDMTGEKLIELLQMLSIDRLRLLNMAIAARRLAKPDAAKIVVEEILFSPSKKR